MCKFAHMQTHHDTNNRQYTSINARKARSCTSNLQATAGSEGKVAAQRGDKWWLIWQMIWQLIWQMIWQMIWQLIWQLSLKAARKGVKCGAWQTYSGLRRLAREVVPWLLTLHFALQHKCFGYLLSMSWNSWVYDAGGALASGLLSGGVQAMSADVTKPANGTVLCWWDCWQTLYYMYVVQREGIPNNPKRAAQIGKTAGVRAVMPAVELHALLTLSLCGCGQSWDTHLTTQEPTQR